MRKPRIIFFDTDGTEPDLDDYFAVGTCVAMANGSADEMAGRTEVRGGTGLVG